MRHLKKMKLWHIVFISLAVYLFMLYGKIFLQFDDYGYLSLSYGAVEPGVIGSKYNIVQLLKFMYDHYFHANGRIIYLFVDPFLNMIGGLKLIQVCAALSLMAVLLLIFHLTIKEYSVSGNEKNYLACFIAAGFGMIGIGYYRDGLGWYTAEFLYVLPAIPFLLYAKWLYGNEHRGCVLACIGALLAAWSEEQWYIAVVVLTLFFFIQKFFYRETISRLCILPGIIAALGGIPTLISPGIVERLHSGRNAAYLAMPVWTRFIKQIIPTVNIFYFYGLFYIALFLAGMLILIAYLWQKAKTRNEKIFCIAFLLYSLAIWILLAISAGTKQLLAPYFRTGYLFCCMIAILIFYKMENQRFMAAITLAAFASVGCMAFVPEHASRLMIPFVLLSYLFLSGIFIRVLRTWKKTMIVGMLLLMIPVALWNMYHNYLRYDVNYPVQIQNDIALKEVSAHIKEGDQISRVELTKLPDPIGSAGMQYEKGYEFMKTWMEEYYEIPHNQVDFIWKEK